MFSYTKKQDNNLVDETGIDSFRSLADLDIRKDVIKTLAVGFENLPRVAPFVSKASIEKAREYATKTDK